MLGMDTYSMRLVVGDSAHLLTQHFSHVLASAVLLMYRDVWMA
jgi:hypothetical protein